MPSNPKQTNTGLQSKQTSGFCGTRVQVGLYSGEIYPDEQCPNCGSRETDTHLMQCPDVDRTRLLIDNVEELEKMDGDGRQDRSKTHLLDSEVYTNTERQAILSAWVHV